jgi:hypothetical protein
MDAKTITLRVGVGLTSGPESPIGDADLMLSKAVENHFRYVALEWPGAPAVVLPVEDDVLFLAMACVELPEALTAKGRHEVVLGDGLLQITASVDRETVEVVARYAEHRDRRFLKTTTTIMTCSDYLSAWGELGRQLVLQVDAPVSTPPASSGNE